MKQLLSIFNFSSAKTVPVSRRQLADIVAPLMEKRMGMGNAAIAHGWDEAAEWLRIGFDAETDKGSLYHALHTSLRRVADAIRNTPESSITVEIEKIHLQALKAACPQLTEASHSLEIMTRLKTNTAPSIVEDRHGNRLEVPVVQIYNRPYAAHDVAGMKLDEIQDNLERFFEGHPVKPASERQLNGFIPRRHY